MSTNEIAARDDDARNRRIFLAVLAQTMLLQVVIVIARVTTSYKVIAEGYDPFWIGGIAAAYAALPLLLAVPMGRHLDASGAVAVSLPGGALMLGASLGCLWASDTLPSLLAFNALMGTGHLFCMAAGQFALSRRPDRDFVFGYYTMSASIGQIAGPLIISALSAGSAIPDIDMLFAVASVIALPLLFLPFLLRVPPRPDAQTGKAKGSIASLLHVPGLPIVIVFGAILLGAQDLFTVFLPLVGMQNGLDAAMIGVLLGVKAVAAVVVRVFYARLAASIGRRRLATLSAILAAVGMACFIVPLPPAVAVVAAVAVGVGLAIGITVTLAEAAELAPAAIRGLALSVRLTVNRLLQMSLPLGAGAFSLVLGAGGVLALVGASLLVGSAAYGRTNAGRGGGKLS